jgi:hypothetical protein
LATTLKRPDVAGLELVKKQADALTWLEENIRVEYPNNGEILRISMRGSDGRELATLVNAVTEVYLKEVVEQKQNGPKGRIDVLQELYDQYRAIFTEKEQTAGVLAQALGLRNFNERDSLIQQDVADCLRELRRNHREARRTRLALIENKLRMEKADKEGQEKWKKSSAQMEEKLAILTAQERQLLQEKEDLQRGPAAARQALAELTDLRDEMKLVTEKAELIGQQLDRLKFEQHFPPRIRLLLKADDPRAK